MNRCVVPHSESETCARCRMGHNCDYGGCPACIAEAKREPEGVVVEIVERNCDPSGDTLTVRIISGPSPTKVDPFDGLCAANWSKRATLTRIEGEE